MTDRSSVPLAGALENTNQDFLELLRMLAHRLSQPLTSLRGSVEVALLGDLDVSESWRVLQLALQESHRMAEALDTLREVIEMEVSGDDAQCVSWTRKVEELLGPAAPDAPDCAFPLVSDVKEDVWVKANPQHLAAATARLIAGAVRAARGNRVVQISLSAGAETACLRVCEEVPSPNAEAGASGRCPPQAPETTVLTGLDRGVVRRAIERQGGRLEVSQDSETYCYQLSLPLAMPEIVGKVLP